MRMAMVAGTPGSGKTSVLRATVRALKEEGFHPALVKVDCLWTDDEKRMASLDVPVKVALARDMCPDHFAIYNTEGMLDWAKSTGRTCCWWRRRGFACAARPTPTAAWRSASSMPPPDPTPR